MNSILYVCICVYGNAQGKKLLVEFISSMPRAVEYFCSRMYSVCCIETDVLSTFSIVGAKGLNALGN